MPQHLKTFAPRKLCFCREIQMGGNENLQDCVGVVKCLLYGLLVTGSWCNIPENRPFQTTPELASPEYG